MGGSDELSHCSQDFNLLRQEFQEEVLQSPMHHVQQIMDTDVTSAEIQVSQDAQDSILQPQNIEMDSSKEALHQFTDCDDSVEPPNSTKMQISHNDLYQSQDFLTPKSLPNVPARCFLEIFSGRKHKFSSYIRSLGIKTLQPLDILLSEKLDILNNDVYQSILRLVASKQVGTLVAAPPCTEYSVLKLQQPGPLPCRSPDSMDRPLFDTEVCHRKFYNSREIIHRTITILELQHIHGGYSAFESPLSAMTWNEPIVQEARKSFLTETAIISHCRVLENNDTPLNKHWQFVSDIIGFHKAELQCTCPHKHGSFAGKTEQDGTFASTFASSRTAEYPLPLVQHLTPFLRLDESPNREELAFIPWEMLLSALPTSPPIHFQHIPDGAGLVSSAVWPIPFKPDIFHTLRKELESIAIKGDIPRRLLNLQHQKITSTPFDERILQMTFRAFENFFSKLGNIPSFDITPGQPFRLHALYSLAQVMDDPDAQLIPLLLDGVDLGIKNKIASSGTWPQKEDINADTTEQHSFQIFDQNWLSAEGDDDTLQTLIHQEIQDGFVTEFGTLEQAQKHFGTNLAIGKLGIAKQQPDKPRLVLDSTISGLNPRSQEAIQEKCSYPRIFNLQQCMPSYISKPYTFLNIDVKSAHKRIKVKLEHQGLLAFQFRDVVYHYKVLHFGGTCSAYYWTRLASLFLRLFHQLLYLQHFALVFVDDFIFGFDQVAAPLQSSVVLLVIAFLNIPLSWHKLEMGLQITWIGWLLNEKRQKLIRNLRPLTSAGKFRRNDIEMVTGHLLWVSDVFIFIRWSLGTLYSILSRPGIQLVRLDRQTIRQVLQLLDEHGKLTHFIQRPFIPQGSILSRLGKVPFHSGQLQQFGDKCFELNFAWASFWNCRSNRVQIYESEAGTIQGILQYIQDCIPTTPLSIPIRTPLQAGADAYATENQFGLGAWLTLPQGEVWMSIQGTREQLPSFLQANSLQSLIISFETMAQALLLLMFQKSPYRGINFQIASKVDNQAKEAILAQGFTQLPIPLKLTQAIQRISFQSNVSLQPYRCTSQDNARADSLSRGFYSQERSQDRIDISLQHLLELLFPG